MSTSEIVLEETPYLNLTTRGRKTGLKHDVELWFAFEDGKLYFLAHESSQWWKNLAKTPRVEVEVSEILFEGTGRLVPQKLEHTFELFRRKNQDSHYRPRSLPLPSLFFLLSFESALPCSLKHNRPASNLL